MTANPGAPKKPAPPPQNANQTALELGGGGLAILALGAAAVAIANGRRRRKDEEAWNYDNLEPAAEPDAGHVVAEHEPRMIAPEPSAFAWGKAQASEQHANAASDDRRAGETWVERAYRGPTADNPSLSLRKRLKRAAFFDKREREAAAGRAAPVEADAGLPENAIEQRELEAA